MRGPLACVDLDLEADRRGGRVLGLHVEIELGHLVTHRLKRRVSKGSAAR